MNRQLILLVLIALTAGCAEQKARTLSLETLKTVNAYEKLVEVKINAESAFYRNQRQAINDRVFGPPVDSGDDKSFGQVEIDKSQAHSAVTQTLYYGRLIQTAERDAELVSETVIRGRGMPATESIEYLERGLAHEAVTYAELIRRERELNSALNDGLQKLKSQKSRLAKVRKNLTTLSTGPTNAQQLDALLKIAEVVQQELQSDDE